MRITRLLDVAPGRVNQLRDPAVLVDGNTYLFSAIAGESGLAVARVDW